MLNDNRVCKIIQINKEDFQKQLLLNEDGFLDLKSNKDLYVKQLLLSNYYI